MYICLTVKWPRCHVVTSTISPLAFLVQTQVLIGMQEWTKKQPWNSFSELIPGGKIDFCLFEWNRIPERSTELDLAVFLWKLIYWWELIYWCSKRLPLHSWGMCWCVKGERLFSGFWREGDLKFGADQRNVEKLLLEARDDITSTCVASGIMVTALNCCYFLILG